MYTKATLWVNFVTYMVTIGLAYFVAAINSSVGHTKDVWNKGDIKKTSLSFHCHGQMST